MPTGIKQHRIALYTLMVGSLVACGENNNATADAGSSPGGRSGTITMAGETYTADSWIQCSVFQQDTVSISGSAGGNEFTVDVFRLGTAQLAITVDGAVWRGNALAPKVSVDDATISGVANLGSPDSGEMRKAEFDFSCR